MKNIFLVVALIFALTSIGTGQEQPIAWIPIQPGIWKATIGKESSFSLLKVMENRPQTEALRRLPVTVFPLRPEDVVASTLEGTITIRFPLEEQEAIFGLGLNFKTVNQR